MAITPFTKKKLTHAILLGLALGASVSVMPHLHAAEQQADTAVRQYDIAAGTLDAALGDFGRISGRMVAIDPALTNGISSKGLRGRYTEQQALSALLRGTGLEAFLADNSGYRLRKAANLSSKTSEEPGATTLPEIAVATTAERGGITEGTGSYTTNEMRTATKLALSIRETPQSVTVITSQMMEDRKISDFDTLMNTVTGVRAVKGVQDSRSSYYFRGFFVDSYQMDGIPMYPNTYAINNYNMDKFDRVEIVKGATGLTTGAGGPGAAINMVRKHANSKEFTGSVDVSAGNWNTYKFKADISTPLNQDGSVRGRLVASHRETDTFKNRVHNEHDLVYAVIDADITSSTTLSAGASYELEDLNGDSSNLPAFYTDGTKTNFSRSKNFTPDWASWDTERKSYFVEAKHRFANDVSLNAVYTHNNIKTKDRKVGYLGVWGGFNKDGSGLTYDYLHMPQDIKEDNFDVYASIPLRLANRDHEIIAGFQYNRQKWNQKMLSDHSYTINNFFTETGSEIAYAGDNLSIPWRDEYTKQTAFYLTGKLSLRDDLKLILGGRLTNWKYDAIWQGATNQKYDAKNEFTPFAGVVYDIDMNHSVYASYTNIFKPQNYKNANDKLLDPLIGNNYEVGIKGEYFDKRLNAGLSLFKVKQENSPVQTDTRLSNGTFAYRAAKGVVSEGGELEVSGKITDNWNIQAGFTHFKAEEANGEKYNTRAPRKNINFFTKYSFNKFSIGAGVNWRSKGYIGSGNRKVTQDAFAVVDLMASYDLSNNLLLQLNINNLFDKKYYSGYTAYEYAYSEPLNGMLSLKYQF